ncbi:MAG: TetR/AcrR family transcriptional regulator [Kaistella sp.]|nr:TetR/AcrR family transcriptional regulator [Kaistella sp.]
MEVQISFKVNESLFLKDPETSEIGKSIITNSIELLYEIGYENFTFKKLSERINSTEATVYRYFSNKHKMLLYILNWYWNYVYYLSQIYLTGIAEPEEKIKMILKLITDNYREETAPNVYDLNKLYAIVVSESSKVYLVKDVDQINREKVFKPYKDLCGYVAKIILEYAPHYKFPKSLASTVIETAHDQQFFKIHLPNLTDSTKKEDQKYVLNFLENLLFAALNQKE